MRTRTLLTIVAFGTLFGCSTANEESGSEAKGYYLSSKLWPHTDLRVCWDTGGYEEEKSWVKARIEETWEKESAIDFQGWGTCQGSGENIRIKIEDAGPRTLGAGVELDGEQGAMRLNFTFKKWRAPSCWGEKRKSCIESIAIHEFGHALGISHEHNRPDRDKNCKDEKQGYNGDVMVGAYDKYSIMNYCNNVFMDNKLTKTDKAAIRKMYPTKKPE